MQAVELLLGKVELRFGERAQLDERPAQRLNGDGELPTERAHRTARGLLARRVDEIRDSLRLCEVESTFQKRTPREFAGFGQSRARVQAGRKQHMHYHGAAVPLQLEHFLAGVGMWCQEIERDAFVDRLAGRIAKTRERGRPRWRDSADDSFSDAGGERSREAHDANAAPASGRCYRSDRVACRLTAWHGQACRD